ncbi:hypothetical protein BDV39DRAFT_184384 [Aspergillus sergii]|uniref:Uncharacterized protein n=1 Tax=Aspergillus sergii TaxID=1034303 RepID=A0A5N6WMN8_9EURO|nr:hypothetical protein BDV39DRAFT_184384 [Aspergillus sergii]
MVMTFCIVCRTQLSLVFPAPLPTGLTLDYIVCSLFPDTLRTLKKKRKRAQDTKPIWGFIEIPIVRQR